MNALENAEKNLEKLSDKILISRVRTIVVGLFAFHILGLILKLLFIILNAIKVNCIGYYIIYVLYSFVYHIFV
jgi:hypothetical protein